jgi:hypothetical protein
MLLSSPFGKRGHFYESWEHGGPDWLRVKVTAEDCPRISPEWLAQERAAIGDWWFGQEYRCEWREASDAFFDFESIQRALSGQVVPLFPVGDEGAFDAA